ncbi:mas-related G-protein coupled receptor member H-like [Sphaerodactylus townsendi]|uniref:mas-related G-protein coupled receptor member H-like n=1 Tax=Sphaerodactylus townsendi TaxID=933632 RepID=UPI00202626D7|nr:mas-related G-protein coupled receptor member H-like [Sphaerodactylus townsendi]
MTSKEEGVLKVPEEMFKDAKFCAVRDKDSQSCKGEESRRKSRKRKLSIITDIGLTILSIMDTALEYNNYLDNTSFPNDSTEYNNIFDDESANNIEVFSILLLVICFLGAMGNGTVIWLLGFCIKRNPFIIYILNLAVADLGFLLSTTFRIVTFQFHDGFYFTYEFLFTSMYSASQFLLTAISIDRCVAVFFPLWYKGHQPKWLSRFVCALLWVLSFLLTAVTCTLLIAGYFGIELYFQCIVNGLLCLPIMTVTSVALFIKLRFKARQHQRRKLLTVVLLTLVFFLLFAFPLNTIFILSHFIFHEDNLLNSAVVLACLNSSVNPAIYTLVGRQRKSRHKESMKMILQKVFKEEEGCTERNPS